MLKTLKTVFTGSLLHVRQEQIFVERKSASLFVVSLGEALKGGMPHLSEVDWW